MLYLIIWFLLFCLFLELFFVFNFVIFFAMVLAVIVQIVTSVLIMMSLMSMWSLQPSSLSSLNCIVIASTNSYNTYLSIRWTWLCRHDRLRAFPIDPVFNVRHFSRRSVQGRQNALLVLMGIQFKCHLPLANIFLFLARGGRSKTPGTSIRDSSNTWRWLSFFVV